jgi:hypothetical protein
LLEEGEERWAANWGHPSSFFGADFCQPASGPCCSHPHYPDGEEHGQLVAAEGISPAIATPQWTVERVHAASGTDACAWGTGEAKDP